MTLMYNRKVQPDPKATLSNMSKVQSHLMVQFDSAVQPHGKVQSNLM